MYGLKAAKDVSNDTLALVRAENEVDDVSLRDEYDGLLQVYSPADVERVVNQVGNKKQSLQEVLLGFETRNDALNSSLKYAVKERERVMSLVADNVHNKLRRALPLLQGDISDMSRRSYDASQFGFEHHFVRGVQFHMILRVLYIDFELYGIANNPTLIGFALNHKNFLGLDYLHLDFSVNKRMIGEICDNNIVHSVYGHFEDYEGGLSKFVNVNKKVQGFPLVMNVIAQIPDYLVDVVGEYDKHNSERLEREIEQVRGQTMLLEGKK